ncbi:MAG: hypothetical protein JRF22_04495 [Deltaproteobacteria bacterium]|nr:hypothetical protein [Deltaproteobacteria bacterium]
MKKKSEFFLNHLALKANVATSGQNQALNAWTVSEPMGQNMTKKLDPSPPLKETPRESPLPGG